MYPLSAARRADSRDNPGTETALVEAERGLYVGVSPIQHPIATVAAADAKQPAGLNPGPLPPHCWHAASRCLLAVRKGRRGSTRLTIDQR